MKNVVPIFAERLLGLIKENKYKDPKDFALKIGIPYTTLNNWLLNKRCPSINYLNLIADFFGETTDYLLGRVDYK